jgi:hypothetical protein
MDREISAIDAIYQIFDKINDLEKRIQVIDDNIKILNNKITKLNKNVSQETSKSIPTATTTPQPTFNDSDLASTTQSRDAERLLLGPTKVYGYIMTRARQPISDVIINIFDSNKKLVKTNKTNSDGYWESRLPAGSYVVEYIHSKFKPVNKEIDIAKNIKEYEVK